MMDFEAGNWDVEKDANELNTSLFQENKKKKIKQSRKRKSDTNQSVPDSDVKKKKDATNETGKDGNNTSDVPKVPTKKQLSRKEKRKKIWDEKILKRKTLKENGIDLDSSKEDTGSVHQSSPEKKGLDNKKEQDKGKINNSQNQKTFAGNQSTLTRFEKRKLKFEERKKSMKRRLERKEAKAANNPGDANAENQEKVNDKSESVKLNANKKEHVMFQDDKEGQLNRKERKKLLWKQKLKERKQQEKQEKLMSAQDTSGVSNEGKDNDSNTVVNTSGDQDKNTISSSKKQKKNKHKKTEKGETVNNKKDADSTENVEDKNLKKSSENEGEMTDSIKGKKKRKRVCKRNKFKIYVKSEHKKVAEDSKTSETELDSTISSAENLKDIETNLDTSMSETKQKKKKRRKNKENGQSSISKQKNKEDQQSPALTQPVQTDEIGTPQSESKGSKHKKEKKSSLDRQMLKAILSPGSRKSMSDEEAETEQSVSVERNEAKEKKPKSLLEKSKDRLNAARFRYLNEQLYTTTGHEAFEMFKKDKDAFDVYHEGFKGQVEKWPTNPVDVIIEKIQSKPKNMSIADFGCGDAKLAQSVPNKVHSFDLVALNDQVTVCDMSKVPLKDGSVDIAVFCLSLMGTNLSSYLKEAHRVLRQKGTLMVAEVTSRFDILGRFVLNVENMGFKLKHQDNSGKMFIMLEFQKKANKKGGSEEEITLKPCLYKKR